MTTHALGKLPAHLASAGRPQSRLRRVPGHAWSQGSRRRARTAACAPDPASWPARPCPRPGRCPPQRSPPAAPSHSRSAPQQRCMRQHKTIPCLIISDMCRLSRCSTSMHGGKYILADDALAGCTLCAKVACMSFGWKTILAAMIQQPTKETRLDNACRDAARQEEILKEHISRMTSELSQKATDQIEQVPTIRLWRHTLRST